jgi:hypothetical protein
VAASEAAIANLALLNIGHTKFITALDDATTEAEVCNLVYAQTRDEMLGAFRWPFAKKRATPSPLGGVAYVAGDTYAEGQMVTSASLIYVALAGDGGTNVGHTPASNATWWRHVSRTDWSYIFLLPTDAIEVRSVSSVISAADDEAVPYEIESDDTLGTILVTNEAAPEVAYTVRITNVAVYPPSFTKALAWALAVRLGAALRKDPTVVKGAMEAAQQALVDAVAEARRSNRGALAASPAGLCNQALVNIGHDAFIGALSDGTAEADLCNRIYAQTRDELLGAYRWPFAKKRSLPDALAGSAYDGATLYSENDAAMSGGTIYLSLQDGNSGHPPASSPTWWVAFGGSIYDPLATYHVRYGAIAVVDGLYYASLQNYNVGHEPTTSPSWWRKVSGAADYGPGTTYTAGTIILYSDGNLYVSLAGANNNHAPNTSPTWWHKVSRTNWEFVYSLPSDCIELRAVSAARRTREDLIVPYELEDDEVLGTVVVTDEKDPEFCYTTRLTSVSLYPADFRLALVWALAAKMAPRLKKDPNSVVLANRAAAAALADAAASAKRESRGDAEPVPHTLAARR